MDQIIPTNSALSNKERIYCCTNNLALIYTKASRSSYDPRSGFMLKTTHMVVSPPESLTFNATFVTKANDFKSEHGQKLQNGPKTLSKPHQRCCVSMSLSTMVDFGS
jgi:hypothetical protein